MLMDEMVQADSAGADIGEFWGGLPEPIGGAARRAPFRLQGMALAVAASLGLWALIVYGVVSAAQAMR